MTTKARTLVVNLVGATAKVPRIDELRAVVKEFKVDVVLAVESNDFRLTSALGRGWIVHQGYIKGRKNSAVAVRVKPGVRKFGTRFFLGSPARRQPPIGNRWIPRLSTFHGRTEATCWQAAHAPPKRNDDLYPGFADALERSWGPEFVVTGGDQNALAVGHLARQHDLYYYRVAGDVMFLASSLPFTAWSYTRPGFDHPIIIADVDLTRTEKR